MGKTRRNKPLTGGCCTAPIIMEAPLSWCTAPSPAPVKSGHAHPSIFTEEICRKTEEALREGKLLQVVSVAREALRTVSTNPVSVAVSGDSGSGTSSFINALREVGHDQEAAAPTGVVRTTEARAAYSSSRFPQVVLWDLPGLGVTAQSVENYVEEMRFSQYDFFILIAAEQFSTNLTKLAKAIEQMGKKFHVVWTKLDRDLSASALSHARLLQTIRENIQGNLQLEGVGAPPVFLVCNHEPSSHDFPKLRDALTRELSVLRLSGPLEDFSRFCDKILSDKHLLLQARASQERLERELGMRSADDLDKVLEAYRLSFGVDDQALRHSVLCLKKSISDYQGVLKCPNVAAACSRGWKLKLTTCMVLRRFLGVFWYVPWLGVRVLTFHRRLQYRCILQLVAQDAKSVLRKMLMDSTFPA